MKTVKRKLKTKVPHYGEYYNASKHFSAGSTVYNAIANGLNNVPGARGRLPAAAITFH